MNIYKKILEENAGNLNALALKDSQRAITYSELFKAVDVTTSQLLAYNLKPYDKVAFLCDDSIEYVIIALAILSLGAVVVPVSASLSIADLEDVIEQMQVQFLLVDSSTIELNAKHALKIEDKKFYLEEKNPRPVLDNEFKALQPAFIRFSSGTTGKSKGVLLSHQAILDRTEAANEGLQISSEDNILWLLSMSFHFVVTILLFLRKGATLILAANDFPAGFLTALQSNKASFIYASPFHYNIMSANESFNKNLLSDLRMAVSTAVALPDIIADKFSDKFAISLSQAYGIIEVGLPFINDNNEKKGSVGRVLSSYRIKIKDPDRDGCGQILLNGKGMYDAYLCPWTIAEDWFNTGDIGYLDDDGYLYIVGRSKNVINFSGMKIFPYEVEEVLNSHDAVEEALVYGQNHDDYGQLPVAKIVLSEAYDKLPKAELRRYCNNYLSPYKVPKAYEIVDCLEKTASGKLKRN